MRNKPHQANLATYRKVRRILNWFPPFIRLVWLQLPIPIKYRFQIKSAAFRIFAPLLSDTPHYLAWLQQFEPRNAMAKKLDLQSHFKFYNKRRPHSSLDGKIPDGVYFNSLPSQRAA